jgi:hypothetical protein
MIETLPLLTPDPRRSDRTIARCHQRLARHQRRWIRNDARPHTTYLAIERALIGGLCVIYISGVAVVAIRMLNGQG